MSAPETSEISGWFDKLGMAAVDSLRAGRNHQHR
jgi:hypothetical protein